jgi:hypothetical protein
MKFLFKIFFISSLITLFSLNIAFSGMAFLWFEVVNIEDEIITVIDEHGDGFRFIHDLEKVNIGDEVIVATDLVYQGGGKWEWVRKRTSIIDIMKNE